MLLYFESATPRLYSRHSIHSQEDTEYKHGFFFRIKWEYMGCLPLEIDEVPGRQKPRSSAVDGCISAPHGGALLADIVQSYSGRCTSGGDNSADPAASRRTQGPDLRTALAAVAAAESAMSSRASGTVLALELFPSFYRARRRRVFFSCTRPQSWGCGLLTRRNVRDGLRVEGGRCESIGDLQRAAASSNRRRVRRK